MATLPPDMALHAIDTGGKLLLDQEWLLTNGIGGFAGSSVVGCNRRRYHGLLVAATNPPVGRIMSLNRVGELLYLPGRKDAMELSSNEFGQKRFHPRGEQYLTRFEIGQTARWTYELEPARIVKELRLEQGRNVATLTYTIEPRTSFEFHLLPFVSLRDFHALQHGTGVSFGVEGEGDRITVSREKHKLVLSAPTMRHLRRPDWWTGHFYAIEHERGQDDHEDLFTPGPFVIHVDKPVTLELTASVASAEDSEFATATAAIAQAAAPESPVLRRLFHAAGQFVVRRHRPDSSIGATVIAGYPWFSDWGRDTMISLPGLLLSTRRFGEARDVLGVFAHYVSEGMIPNVFDDYSNQPHYNTVDASLWFIHACFEYLRESGDRDTFDRELLPACRAIFAGYRDGTRFNIRMDADGLIIAGDAGTQLTWMDAKCDGVCFTPRHGKPVEINALWYNALRLLGEDELAERVQKSFREAFWISPFRGLADVINTDCGRDSAIRPNQIFAVSLPHSPLARDQQHAVVETVRRELLTPMGLRTLSPHDKGYHKHYLGTRHQRDAAYHNGTVWAWLMGPFLDAYLHVHENSADAQQQARQWLAPLVDHLNQACLNQISEIFDAAAPHTPRGAFAQAWSIAEVLRLAVKLGI